MENREILVSGARLLGVSLDASQAAAFERFLDELTRWNQRMNLTAFREKRSIIIRHFLDSLTVVRYLPETINLLDLGSGAGFPGIPLKIAKPRFQVVLLDGSRKRTYFQKHVIRSLDLSGIRSVWGRSDWVEIREALGNSFDVVVSRAVSSLEVYLGQAIHFIPEGGMIIAMRGRDVSVPIRPESLSLRLDKTVSTDLPFEGIRRTLQFFRKTTLSV
ncbi:MAG: 16S rRNA (guanine(527)-N(7))-methyltransferase RsmG [Proteobacteria bacterium]|nr:16S rRNA (guanine(527)-N(7))-methyltransferase RsmG [Pseudomonadota bacterium]